MRYLSAIAGASLAACLHRPACHCAEGGDPARGAGATWTMVSDTRPIRVVHQPAPVETP